MSYQDKFREEIEKRVNDGYSPQKAIISYFLNLYFRLDYGEERVQVIGMARPGLLFVVYTERDKGDTYRIISARRANKREKALYNSMLGIQVKL